MDLCIWPHALLLSPNQWPTFFPLPANVEREISILRFPVASWAALQVKKNQIRKLHFHVLEASKNYKYLIVKIRIIEVQQVNLYYLLNVNISHLNIILLHLCRDKLKKLL